MKNKKIERTKDYTIYNPLTDTEELIIINPTENDKHVINNQWCDEMCKIFEKYRDSFERTDIFTSYATAVILSNCQVVDPGKINHKDREINFKFGKKRIPSDNEDLIYDSFDLIIQNQKHLNDYLDNQRNKYNYEMPY